MLISAAMVVLARNPVHAVMFLILSFFNAAGLFLLMGAEYVAFILMIVYVGAVAVLFLFVVMMLDIDFRELRRGMARYLPVGAAIGWILFAQLALTLSAWHNTPLPSPPPDMASIDNTHAIGAVLYTDYIYPFLVSGLILLTAMIGAVVLTLRERKGIRRQNVFEQILRKREDVVKIRKVVTGEGIK